MKLVDSWHDFIKLFLECLESKIETYEERRYPGEYWSIIWRLKDDTVTMNKTSDLLNKLVKDSYLLDSYRTILAIHTLSIRLLFRNERFTDIFSNFRKLYDLNPDYIRHMVYRNQADSNYLSIYKCGLELFDEKFNYIDESLEIWEKLQIPTEFSKFSEQEARLKCFKLHEFIDIFSTFAWGIEGVIDSLYDGTKRGESVSYFFDNFLFLKSNVDDFKLHEQFEEVNELYSLKFYSVIPFKIRLLLEYLLKQILLERNVDVTKLNLAKCIQKFKNIFTIKNGFPEDEDIKRLRELKNWGNMTAHNIFPAISKKEIDDRKKIILRLVTELIKINPTLFS